MADYFRQVWVPESGIGDGTVFTAARMNYIEDGIFGVDQKVIRNGMGVVMHGSASAVVRPSGFNSITWVGSAYPSAMASGDQWDGGGWLGAVLVATDDPILANVIANGCDGVTPTKGDRFLITNGPNAGIWMAGATTAAHRKAADDGQASWGSRVAVKYGFNKIGYVYVKQADGTWVPDIPFDRIAASGVGFIKHGSASGAIRMAPYTFGAPFKEMIWVGDVSPSNATADDIWVDTGSGGVAFPSVIAASGMGVVVHAGSASVARPTAFKQVFWIGSVEPTNMAADDVWDDTTGDLSVGVIPVVTGLPIGPYDGMEVDLLANPSDDTGNGGVLWRMRYRSATSRWHFVGGPSMFNYILAAAQTTSASYGIGTPTLTNPFAGDFLIKFGANGPNLNAAAYGVVNVGYGAIPASDDDAIMAWGDTGNEVGGESTQVRKTGLAASTVVGLYYRSANGATQVNWSRRWIEMTPIRSAIV